MGEIIPYLSRKASAKVEIIRHDEDTGIFYHDEIEASKKYLKGETINHKKKMEFPQRT